MKLNRILTGVFLAFSLLAFADDQDVKVIKNPEPLSHGISRAINLKFVKSIEELPLESLSVFGGIISATVDSGGNFYFFDYKHTKIIKLNPSLKFLSTIGRKGEGPGEFMAYRFITPITINVGLDDNVYYSSPMARKIVKFSKKGEFLGESRVEHFKPFRPRFDEKSRIYLPSISGDHVIDIYDKAMGSKKSILSNKERQTFLFLKPPACVIYNHRLPDFFNLLYDFTASGDLVVVNKLDLSVSVVDKDKGFVKKKFNAWDDYLLAQTQQSIIGIMQEIKQGKIACGYSSIILDFFIDDCDYLYLSILDSEMKIFLYKYSMNGELETVFRVSHEEMTDLHFFYYKKGVFYAYSLHGVQVFREPK